MTWKLKFVRVTFAIGIVAALALASAANWADSVDRLIGW
jgi:hypothetical protein